MCYNPKPLQFLPFVFLSHINLQEKSQEKNNTPAQKHRWGSTWTKKLDPERHMALSVVLLGGQPICMTQEPQLDSGLTLKLLAWSLPWTWASDHFHTEQSQHMHLGLFNCPILMWGENPAREIHFARTFPK